MSDRWVHPGEKIDDLMRSGLQIIQDPARFCFGMDAVLLTGFIQEGLQRHRRGGSENNKSGSSGKEVKRAVLERVHISGEMLDLGTGTGIIPLLLSAKTDLHHLTGLEIQKDSADMASRSVAMNALQERISIVCGDIREADAIFPPASFSVVTCNPPYMPCGHGQQNPESPKAVARHEIMCCFEDVARVTEKLLRPQGHFYLVHRPFRLPEIITTLCRHHLEPKRLRLVYPYVDKEPNMVLIDCVRGGNPRLTVESPLIVYRNPGQYTQEIYDVYGY